MDQRLYAFWEYDTFPYYLCGEIKEFLDNGSVVVDGYTGMSFKPTKVVPYEQGTQIKIALDRLKVEHKKAMDTVQSVYIEKVQKLTQIDDARIHRLMGS